MKKIIAITGATGRQGSAVLHQVLNAGFSVRALTRSAKSEKVQGFRKLGVEIIEGDMNKPGSLIRGHLVYFLYKTPIPLPLN